MTVMAVSFKPGDWLVGEVNYSPMSHSSITSKRMGEMICPGRTAAISSQDKVDLNEVIDQLCDVNGG